MGKYRILYDTNILVHREDHHVLSNEFIRLSALINELGCDVLIHPLSIEDINNDKDLSRRRISQSKLSTYIQLKEYPRPEKDIEFIAFVGQAHKGNDIIDDHLLYAVYKNAVDFLITEDKGILSKANKTNLDEKVLSIDEAILIFEKLLPKTKPTLLPCFKTLKGWNINLDDEIFNTLKSDYDEFPDWWKQKVASRDVFIYSDNDDIENPKIKAILVLKAENELIDCNPSFQIGKRMKICLFKVSELARGLKLGERLMKIAFEQALSLGLNEIYLTHFTIKNDDLVYLIENFGFQLMGENKRGEEVYLKHVRAREGIDGTKTIDIPELNKSYFPSFYNGEDIKKHVVPIFPEFHKKLFPDYSSKGPKQLPLLESLNVSSSEGYSIKKAYICNSNSKKIKKGDILLFYGTDEIKAITTLGTVEDVYYDLTDAEEVFKLIAKRTVYTFEEIQKICQSKTMVILFRHNLNFMNDVSYDDLLKNSIVGGPIQSITELDESKYRKVIEGNIDECLIIDKTKVC